MIMDLAKAVSTKKIYQWNDGAIWKTSAKSRRVRRAAFMSWPMTSASSATFCAFSPSTDAE